MEAHPDARRPRPTAWLALLLAASAVGATPASAAPVSIGAFDPGLAGVARAQPLGAELRISGLQLDGGPTVELRLERFRVFSPDAILRVDARDRGWPERAAYYRGTVAGDRETRAMLSVRANGIVRGLVLDRGQVWVVEGGGAAALAPGLWSRHVDLETEFAAEASGFRCEADDLPLVDSGTGATPPSALSLGPPPAASSSYAARVAVETDWEYFSHFGNQGDALDYLGDLFAYSSTLYVAEVQTELLVSSVSLWTSSSDPWSATGCSSMLSQLRSYWNSNHGSVSRTVVHMLSGKSAGCGIAYVGVLCNQSYGYGLTSGLRYNFNINSPGVVWDILALSHEIGHNFNSPHTHCYSGLGGSSAQVDECSSSQCGKSGCFCGTPSLPCSGQSGCGTIMSYCHLLSGGYSNITLTFGTGHPHGVLPERVPERMFDHVLSRSASVPGCLDPVTTQWSLTVSKTGSGSGTVTSAPAGIDCGSDCSETFADGTYVTLTPTPASGSSFAGWSGHADCADGQLTMTANRACTATFDADTHTLTVTRAGTGSGSVTSSPAGIDCGSDCSEDFPEGIFVTLTPTPAGGSIFSGWSGHADCTDGRVNINADKTCTANFAPDPATLGTVTISKTGSGYGTVESTPAGIDCGSTCSATFTLGTFIQLAAAADLGSEFVGFGGHPDCPDGRLNLSGDRACTATFDSCAGDPPMTLSGETVTGTATYETCSTLSASDFEIMGPSGNVTFRAGVSIALGEGFTVRSGAQFTAESGQ